MGNLFEDPVLRQNLVEFVYGGGGLMGVHGTTVAFTRWTEGAREDWPEFGIMLGGRGANHKAADEHVFIKLDDPDHPLNQPFGGQGFDYRSEFFRVHEPYSRDRVRVLLSIDTQKTDMNQTPAYGKLVREDNDYALAWVRQYGRGRVFYCTIAHSPSIFWDPKLLEFYLAAAQFALGDLPAPATPSSKLTPAIRAQEKLGWRLGIEAYTFHKYTLFEAIDKTAQLGLPYMGGLSFQKVSNEIPKNFDPQLTDDELKQIRLKLDSAGVRLLTYYIHADPRRSGGLPPGVRVRPQDRHRDVHVRAVAGRAGYDREVLRRIRHQRGAAQSRPESVAPVLESGGHLEGLRGPQQADRRLRRSRLLDAVRHRSDPGSSHAQAAADHRPDARPARVEPRPATTCPGEPEPARPSSSSRNSTAWASSPRCSASNTPTTGSSRCRKSPRALSSSTESASM